MSDDPTTEAAEAAEESTDITPDEITGDFVPALVETAAMAVLDDESVVLDETTGATHLLNQTGTLVVQCFDGVSPLGEISADVAEAFSADPEVVSEDIVALCRELGEVGLLRGVAAHSHENTWQPPTGLEPGDILADLDARTADGMTVDDSWLRGGRTLLVNWGAQCGFCSRIAGELADLEAPLTAAGVRLMLVTTSSAETVATQLADVGGTLPVAHTEQAPPFFAGLGTPVAYVVEDGAVAEPIAYGAVAVPETARRLAGVQSPAG